MIDSFSPRGNGGEPGVPAEFDVTRKFVRVTGTMANGLVEFDFAIGDPDVSVELVMPKSAFDEFCRDNRVEFLTGPSSAVSAEDAAAAEFRWGMHQATHTRFR